MTIAKASSTTTAGGARHSSRVLKWHQRVPAADVLLAGVLTAATFLVHNVSYILSTPFWVDEGWVAVSTRLPATQVTHVTAVTPVGWTLLLRTAVFGGQQRLRLVPLLFSALTVLLGYLLIRHLPWPRTRFSRLAGCLGGLAVLLAPSSLVRNDLKQYTADACVTVLVLLLVAHLERSWSRRRLAAVSVVCVLGFLISAVSLFVGLAAMTALLLSCLVRRRADQVRDVLGAGTATGTLLGLLFILLYQPHVGGDLIDYWAGFYLPVDKGIGPSLSYLYHGGEQMSASMGTGPLALGLLLATGGAVTLVRMGLPALGWTTPILVLELIVLGAAKKYPLFDARTSHFLAVALVLLAAIGAAELVRVAAQFSSIAAMVVALLTVGLFVNHVHSHIRTRSIPAEDVRTPIAYLNAYRRPGDVIVVSVGASEGFGYYWPNDRPSWHKSDANAWHFQTSFPDQPDIFIAGGRTLGPVNGIMRRAVARANQRPGARLWIVRIHQNVQEQQSWHVVLQREPFQTSQAISCSLLLLTPQPLGTSSSPSLDQAGSCG